MAPFFTANAGAANRLDILGKLLQACVVRHFADRTTAGRRLQCVGHGDIDNDGPGHQTCPRDIRSTRCIHWALSDCFDRDSKVGFLGLLDARVEGDPVVGCAGVPLVLVSM